MRIELKGNIIFQDLPEIPLQTCNEAAALFLDHIEKYFLNEKHLNENYGQSCQCVLQSNTVNFYHHTLLKADEILTPSNDKNKLSFHSAPLLADKSYQEHSM